MTEPAQGTVKHYDVASRQGSIVTDDGSEVVIAPTSLGDEVRFLRQGQRVAFEVADEDGQVFARALRVVTFPQG